MQFILRPWRSYGYIISSTTTSSCRKQLKHIILPSRRLNSSQSTINASKASNHHAVYVRSALDAGLVPYEKGWAWQHMLLNRRLNYMRTQQQLDTAILGEGDDRFSVVDQHDEQDKDWILLFEHHPVYTLGRGATEDNLTFLDCEADGGIEKRKRLSRKYRGEDASRLNIDRFHNHHTSSTNNNVSEQEEVDELSSQSIKCMSQPVLAPNGSPIYRIERGGEVTFHGPGQLVMYPLLNLKNPIYQQDLHWYLRNIEEVIIQTLLHFDIKSNRDDINTGVFVGQNKIAAVGVSASKWITTHGLALNVSPNLDNFDKDISIPCGLKDRGVTSISDILGKSSCPSIEEVARVTLRCFGTVFDVDVRDGSSIR